MSVRMPLIAGNWKMHKTVDESVEAAIKLASSIKDVNDVEVMISPVFTSLYAVNNAISDTNLLLGAQNVYWEPKGAFTGEISTEMLKSCGCEYVIIGHSERRQYFGDTDASVNKKIKATIENGLKPVFCIGETEAERDQEKTIIVLDKQVTDGLKDCVSDDLTNLVIAYEPVWAIGTGKTATTDQVDEVHTYLRSLLTKLFGSTIAESTRILYGGSVKPNNISELMTLKDVDGALVGGASLDPETFSQIVHYK